MTKRILTVALAVLMLLTIAFTASAADRCDKSRGPRYCS